jgi:hypothetical protein
MWNCDDAVRRARERLRREGETGGRRGLEWSKTMDVSSSMVLGWSAKEKGRDRDRDRNRNRNRVIVRRTGRSRFR